MALKSSVFACLILALCVGCNNVMAQNTYLKETEKSGFIIPRSENPGKETEKSGFIIPRSENLGKETVKSGTILCEIIGEIKGLWEVRCSNHMFLLCNHRPGNLGKETEKSNIIIIPRSENPGKETEKSGFIIPRSENPGKETEKSGFIIPRSENLGKETVKPEPLSCEIVAASKGGLTVLRCKYQRRPLSVILSCTNAAEKSGFIIPRSENLGNVTPRSENLGKETEKSGNIIP